MESIKLLVVVILAASTLVEGHRLPYPGVGAIFKGPDSSTIVKGPDGSVITSKHQGGAVEAEADGKLTAIAVGPAPVAPVVVAEEPIDVVVKKTPIIAEVGPVDAQIVPALVKEVYASPQAEAAILVEGPDAKELQEVVALAENPIVVAPLEKVVEAPVAPIKVVEPVVAATLEDEEEAKLTGPSGSITTKGESSVVSGPASTTITGKDGKSISLEKVDVVATVPVAPKAENLVPSSVVVSPSQPLTLSPAAPQLDSVALSRANLGHSSLVAAVPQPNALISAPAPASARSALAPPTISLSNPPIAVSYPKTAPAVVTASAAPLAANFEVNPVSAINPNAYARLPVPGPTGPVTFRQPEVAIDSQQVDAAALPVRGHGRFYPRQPELAYYAYPARKS